MTEINLLQYCSTVMLTVFLIRSMNLKVVSVYMMLVLFVLMRLDSSIKDSEITISGFVTYRKVKMAVEVVVEGIYHI